MTYWKLNLKFSSCFKLCLIFYFSYHESSITYITFDILYKLKQFLAQQYLINQGRANAAEASMTQSLILTRLYTSHHAMFIGGSVYECGKSKALAMELP